MKDYKINHVYSLRKLTFFLLYDVDSVFSNQFSYILMKLDC